MRRNNFVWCEDCGEDVLIPHNSKDCANKWKRECIIARNRIAALEAANRIAMGAINDALDYNPPADWAYKAKKAIAALNKEEE